MTETQSAASAALRGPWQAVLSSTDGWLIDISDIDHHEEVNVAVVRGTCLPVADDDGMRLPHGSYRADDILYEHKDLLVGDDDVAGRWTQAQAVADALNAAGAR